VQAALSIQNESNLEAVTGFSPKVSMVPSCNKPGEIKDVLLKSVLDGIKNGRWKTNVEQGRAIKSNKEAYKDLKTTCVPAFTAHGTATYASNSGMKEGNCIAFLDADNVVNKPEKKESLTRDPYVFTLFDSFGGDGFAIACKIPQVFNEQDFEGYHAPLREYFLERHGLIIDEGAKSFKCLRLVSYDPTLFHNENSMVWKSLPTLKPIKKKTEPKKENNHYADIMPLVAKMGHNGFTDDEIQEKVNGFHIDPSSCLSDPENLAKLISNVRRAYTDGKQGTGQSSVQYCGFWTNDFKTVQIQLSLGLLCEVLSAIGWRILDGEYVLVENGVIYKKTQPELYEFIINLVSFQEVKFKAKDVTFTVDQTTLKTKAQKELRGNVKMIALSSFHFTIQRDTATESFFHFRNKSMRVTKDEITLFDRNSAQGVIWDEQLVQYDILEDDLYRPVFAEFLMNVSENNFNCFRSAIGRALHNYNGSEGMRVPWFCDESHRAGKSDGRTGKSLIAKAIGKCRKMDDCHGKDFRPDNQFKFQNVDRSTQVYLIDDVKETFDFKSLYNVTSEGMEYERKNRDRVRLSLMETPQIVITSNHPPQIEQGASTTGRLFILPVKPHYLQYADVGGVKAVHGHVFFDDWNDTEWNRFYWFMAVCVRDYLRDGYVFADQSEIRKNRLREIFIKKVGRDIADDLVEYVYTLPKEFTLESVMAHFDADPTDRAETKKFASCLKSFFEIERKEIDKVRESTPEGRKVVWKII
jgi:hypothetical protein